MTHAALPNPPPTALDRPPGPRPLRDLFLASLKGLQLLQVAIEQDGSGTPLSAALGVTKQAVSFRLKTLRKMFGDVA
jgi:hypothetical protein